MPGMAGGRSYLRLDRTDDTPKRSRRSVSRVVVMCVMFVSLFIQLKELAASMSNA